MNSGGEPQNVASVCYVLVAQVDFESEIPCAGGQPGPIAVASVHIAPSFVAFAGPVVDVAVTALP